MGLITCQFVRPDKLLFEGKVQSLVLVTEYGELGVWPQHAAMIAALGDGVVRLHLPQEDGGDTVKIIVSGGYAEVSNDMVIILADHARREDDIERDVVLATRAAAEAKRDTLPAYYDNKIKWCNLLLEHC